MMNNNVALKNIEEISVFEKLAIKRNSWIKKGERRGFTACQCATHELGTRELIENQIVSYTIKNFSDREKAFSILSVGSGALLQDYIILKKLISLGYKGINITLVDPVLKLSNNVATLAAIIDKINQKKGLNISLCSFPTSSECLNYDPSKKYQLIYAIDFDRMHYEWEMLLTVRDFLTEKGRLFLTSKSTRIAMAHEFFDLRNPSEEEPAWLSHFVEKNSALKATASKIRFGINMPGTFYVQTFTSTMALVGKGFRWITIDLKKNEDCTAETVLKIKKLCSSFSKFFTGVHIEINEISAFESQGYDLLSVSSHQVITHSFLEKEEITNKMKQNGVVFLNFGECLTDYAMSQFGLGYYDYTKKITELAKRRIEIGEAKKEISMSMFGTSKGLYVNM